MSRASTLAKAVGADGSVSTTGNTTLGDASGDAVTFNAATANIPNGLAFSGGSLTLSGTFNNLTVGRGAGAVDTNTAVGYQAAYTNTTGSDLVALGYLALYSNTTAIRNVAIGRSALRLNTTGEEQVAVGSFALQNSFCD